MRKHFAVLSYSLMLCACVVICAEIAQAKDRDSQILTKPPLCDDSKKKAISTDDAYKHSSLVFIGTVLKTTWLGPGYDAVTTTVDGTHIVANGAAKNNEEVPFDTRDGRLVTYKTYFLVSEAWKDDARRIAPDDTVVVEALNGSWAGMQFEPRQRYVVFARNDGDQDKIPYTSICNRTKPAIYATDDVDLLEKNYSKLP